MAVFSSPVVFCMTAQVQQVLDLLVSCSRAEEECRNVVAECLGRLALLHPAEVTARLRTGAAMGLMRLQCAPADR
jgi:hypothetical protein